MSGGRACSCGQAKLPVQQRHWVIRDFRCNHSAFNGNRKTSSRYSSLQCVICGSCWRTTASYVNLLPIVPRGDPIPGRMRKLAREDLRT